MDGFDVAMRVAFKFRRGRQINARVGAKFRGGFLLAVIHLVNLRPFRPRIVLGAFQRRLRQNFHLHERFAAVPHRSAHAIRSGIAAADDDDVLAGGVNEMAVLVPIQNALGVRREKFHREMDAFQFAAGNRQIARLGRAGRENHGVEFLQQFFRRIIFPDLGVADKFDAFRFEQFRCGASRLPSCRASCWGCHT